MKYLAVLACTAIACVALTNAVDEARAQTRSLDGIYELLPQRSDDVPAVIRATTANMNFIERPIARSRLKKVSSPAQRIQISSSAAQIEIVSDKENPVRMPADGGATRWTRSDGEVFEVTGTWAGTQLTQRFKAEDGERVNAYSLSDDGRLLTLEVTLTSPRLPQPMKYSLAYGPADAG